jgi:hypothetical protein
LSQIIAEWQGLEEPQEACLFERFVNLDTALEDLGHKLEQIYAALLGLSREIFPHAPLDGDRHQHLGDGRNVVKSANSFAEVDIAGHVVIIDGAIIHKPS